MNKIVKLSLVTAVAIAGLTTVNAASLEEAIKGVDVSGMMRYRYTDTKTKRAGSNQVNAYDIEINAKIPVNDSIKAVLKIDVGTGFRADDDSAKGANLSSRANPTNSTNALSLPNALVGVAIDRDGAGRAAADSDINVDIEDAYFLYTNANFVGSLGKQNIPGPHVDGAQGTGIVLTVPVGPVSLVGTFFNGTNTGAVNGPTSYLDIYQAAIYRFFWSC